MWTYPAVTSQDILNDAMRQNYEAAVRSADTRMRLAWETQSACCDAFHVHTLPEQIRCCMLTSQAPLGVYYGF